MATNISKYVQLNDFVLLEYEFNRDSTDLTTLTNPIVVQNGFGTKYFFEGDGALGGTNNVLPMNSVPTNEGRTAWYWDADNYDTTYWSVDLLDIDTSVNITTTKYVLDTVKVHIISGYNFDDIGGFLIQVRAIDTSGYLVDLANFTYGKQLQVPDNNIIKFATNALYLGNRFYDKYLEFKIPSIQTLGGVNKGSVTENIESELSIQNLSDVYITYSTLFDIVDNEFILDEQVNVQLPVTSVADNFNCFIAESTAGDFIEYYATWNNLIIGNTIGEIESGRIRLYTSNNPNDNYQEFEEAYGMDSRKWVLIHEISVFEHIPGGTSLLTQKFSFTQDDNFNLPNYFRPILRNSDITSSYSIQYTCRLMNRMDGTQIIRKSSFSSMDPKKYGLKFGRLNVDNLLPYKVFNRVEAEKPNINIGSGLERTKYVKVFYDTTNITLNEFNEVYPQGTGPLFLKSYDSIYKFKFEKIDKNGDRINVDLSGAYNYGLFFKLDDNTNIEVGPTYSTNMNTTIGEMEFKLSEDQLLKLKSQKNNKYSIIVKNPNGTSYAFYEGVYYSVGTQTQQISLAQEGAPGRTVSQLENEIGKLKQDVNRLTDENNKLKAK